MSDIFTASPPTRADWPMPGWAISSPAEQGLDSSWLIAAQEHLAARLPTLNSLLIVRHGRLVYEAYQGRANAETLHSIKSVTKSALSALVGVALRTGDLPGLDERLGYILPEAFATIADQDKRAITMRDLLTMRSGLDWAEYGPSLGQMTGSADWVKSVLELPLIHAPGTVFNYSTGDTHLLAAAIQRLTGMTLLEYADLYLFDPLGIQRRRWQADPQGVTIGGTELRLTARDMAKFGYLYLHNGQWNGSTILPPGWVEQTATYHTTRDADAGASCQPWGYGLLWWLRTIGGQRSLVAAGYGGQFIYVIPAFDLVVVLTGALNAVPELFRDSRMICEFNLVEDFVVPALIPGR
jgi:CubicO group peptidase (beta-lactamase class C family)